MNELEKHDAEVSVTKDERTFGMFCHLSTLIGFLVPFGNFLGPLVIWLLKKDEMPFVDDQGREALNFQITMLFGYLICIVLMFVVVGFFLIWPLLVFDIIMVIIASIKANDGEKYRYPFAVRLIK